jgi:hydrogenase maturation protease
MNLAASLGPVTAHILVVGCEPKDFGDELEGRMGLSPPVQAMVEEASNMIEELIKKILAESKDHSVQLENRVLPTDDREVAL